MTNPNGTATETAAKRYIEKNGFPKVDRRPKKGRLDEGDLLLCDGIIAEVKYRDRLVSGQEIASWMLETENETKNARADYGFLIVRRKFVNVAQWPCFWWIKDVVELHLPTPGGINDSSVTTPRTAIVSISLIDSVMMLRHCGYGEEP